MNIAHQRLHNQGIADAPFQSAGEVVGWLGAVQAQDYLASLWAVGLRMQQATDATIEQAIADRTIVRTWLMRGTLHFVAAADVRWMLKLLTPRVIAGSAARFRELELDEAVFARSAELFVRALEGGRQLSRPAMFQVLEAAGIPSANQRGPHILGKLSQNGLLCFGTREGKQPSFALLDEWVPPAQAMERDEALAELTRRYFTAHGPAKVQDLMWWAGLNTAEVKAGLEMVKAELVQATWDGTTYWMASSATPVEPNPSLHLLPAFDEYLLGYRERTAVLDPEYKQRVVPGSNGVFYPIIVSNGRVVGTWKRTLKKRVVVVTPQPFAALSPTEHDAFATAAHRYGTFLGLPVQHA